MGFFSKSKFNSTDIATTLATKFIHDITGAIGAINNGVELLADSPNMRNDANNLISNSASDAMNKLKFFRIAYGNSTEKADYIGIAQNYLSSKKINFLCKTNAENWRIIYNIIIILSNSLIKGGEIILQANIITAKGEKIKRLDEMEEILSNGKINKLTPYNINAAFLSEILDKKISINYNENNYEFII